MCVCVCVCGGGGGGVKSEGADERRGRGGVRSAKKHESKPSRH